MADMSGVVAPVVTAAGVAVLGSTLKEWIRRGDILTLHKDTTTGAPRLMVDLVEPATPAGSSLKLGDLNNVATGADTAAAGMLLGTTSTGQWAPVTNPGDWIGNLLTPAEAGCASAPSGSQCTITVDEVGRDGQGLRIVAGGATIGYGLHGWVNRGTMPVTGGATYTHRVSVRALAVSGTPLARVTVYWWTAPGTNSPASPPRADSGWAPLTATWVDLELAVNAPADATHASIWVAFSGVTVGDIYAADQQGWCRGAGGDWAMPGVPIVNQGIRHTAPNGTDSLTEVWDSTKGVWVPVRYSSGVRTVTGGKALRENSTVTWTGTDAAPAGFRDTYATGGKTYLTGDPLPTSLPGTPE
jgi:hypothetical protein